MTDENLIQKWADLGMRLVQVNGHHQDRPCPTDVDPSKWPKRPVRQGWNDPDFDGMTAMTAARWVEEGGFIGVVVPEGIVVLDLDMPENLEWFWREFEQNPDRFGPVVRTRNGVHAWFRLPEEVQLSGGSRYMTLAGFGVTQRVGGKNFVIMPPSENKSLLTPDADFQNLPQLPGELWPADPAPPRPRQAALPLPLPTFPEDAELDDDCRRGLELALNRLQGMQSGERHDTILKVGNLVGGFIGAGRVRVDHPLVEQILAAAADSGSDNAAQTALDALHHGMQAPISLTTPACSRPAQVVTQAVAVSGNSTSAPQPSTPIPTGGPRLIDVTEAFLSFKAEVSSILSAACASMHIYQLHGTQTVVRVMHDGALVQYESTDSKVTLASRVIREAGYEWGRPDRKGILRPCDTPIDKLKQLVITPEEFLQPLDLVVHSPALFLQGFVQVQPGYQVSGDLHLFAHLTNPLPDLTHQEAIDTVEDIIQDTSFKSNADRTNLVGACLSVALKLAIDGAVPIADVEAAQSDSGKTVVTKIICAALDPEDVAQPVNPTEQKNSGTERKLDNEEITKELHAAIMEGKLLIPLDNFDEFCGSRSLEKAITARRYSGRILGKSQLYKARYAPSFVINGIKSNKKPRSWIRRGFRICLEPRATLTGRAWHHVGLENKLENDVGGIRTRLQAALVAVVKHFVAIGMPRWSGTPMSSFEAWSMTIGGILEASGFHDFLGNEQQKFLNTDDELEARTLFLQVLHDELGDRIFLARDVLDRQRIIRTAFHDAGIPSETIIKTWDPTNVGLALHKIEGGFTTVGLMLESAGKNRRGGTQYRICRPNAGGSTNQPSAASGPPAEPLAEDAEDTPSTPTDEGN